MASTTGGANAVCPYFESDNGYSITCEGVITSTKIKSQFRTQNAKDKWIIKACALYQYAQLCPIASYLESKYYK